MYRALGKGEQRPMLWWLIGLWLLSPALLLIFWLLDIARPAAFRRFRDAQRQPPVGNS